MNLSKNTIDSYKNDLSQFNAFCNKKIKEISKVDKKFINEFVLSLSKKKFSNASLNRKVSSLKNFFNYLFDDDILKFNPIIDFIKAKQEKKMPNFLSQDEINKIISIVSEDKSHNGMRNLCLIRILSSSGIRISELVSLKIDAIQWIDREKFIIKPILNILGKGNKERIVIIDDLTLDALHDYLQIRKHYVKKDKYNYLFPSKNNSHITRVYVGLLLKKFARMANIDIKKVHPHAFRHSVALKLLNGGMNIRYIQEFLGHSDISTTAIYTKINPTDLIKFVENFHSINKHNDI